MADRPYLQLLAALEKGAVRYAIAGGLAVVLHGVPRMTFDLDLMVDLADDNLQRLVGALTVEGYQPRLPVPLANLANEHMRNQWIAERNLVAFSLFHPQRPMEEVDILVAPGMSWSEVAPSLLRRTINGITVSVVGRAALKRMKLASGRDKDLADAALLGDNDD